MHGKLYSLCVFPLLTLNVGTNFKGLPDCSIAQVYDDNKLVHVLSLTGFAYSYDDICCWRQRSVR
jgi:hypothetical protein